jgi:hypothetical protein
VRKTKHQNPQERTPLNLQEEKYNTHTTHIQPHRQPHIQRHREGHIEGVSNFRVTRARLLPECEQCVRASLLPQCEQCVIVQASCLYDLRFSDLAPLLDLNCNIVSVFHSMGIPSQRTMWEGTLLSCSLGKQARELRWCTCLSSGVVPGLSR